MFKGVKDKLIKLTGLTPEHLNLKPIYGIPNNVQWVDISLISINICYPKAWSIWALLTLIQFIKYPSADNLMIHEKCLLAMVACVLSGMGSHRSLNIFVDCAGDGICNAQPLKGDFCHKHLNVSEVLSEDDHSLLQIAYKQLTEKLKQLELNLNCWYSQISNDTSNLLDYWFNWVGSGDANDNLLVTVQDTLTPSHI